MRLFKLTDEKGRTRAGMFNECTWGPGFTHRGSGIGQMCGPGFIHAYTSPLLAVFCNPIHAMLYGPRLWLAEGVLAKTDGLKCACVSLTTVRELKLPVLTDKHYERIAADLADAVPPESTIPFYSYSDWIPSPRKYDFSTPDGRVPLSETIRELAKGIPREHASHSFQYRLAFFAEQATKYVAKDKGFAHLPLAEILSNAYYGDSSDCY